MASSGMLRRVDLVRTDVSEELSASFIGVTKIGELGATLVLTSNRSVQRLLVTASVVPSSILITLVQSFSSVFVRHTFNFPNYFKTLKHLTFITTCFGLYDHHQVLKLRFEEVAAFPFF
jgi:hypothetical protein